MSVTSYSQFTDYQKKRLLSELLGDLKYYTRHIDKTTITLETVSEMNVKSLRANGMEHQKTLEADVERSLRVVGLINERIKQLESEI